MISLIPTIILNHEGLYGGDLKYYYKKVFYAPNTGHPYHNFRHMMHMMCQTYLGAKYMGYPSVGKDRFRALLIAAMFHDYGHSGKMGNDSEEIKRAQSAAEQFILKEDKILLPEIVGLIGATEFPHADCDPTTAAKILRDADMSQGLSDVWQQQILFGLSLEKGTSPIECLKEQKTFLSSLSFYTHWGKRKFGKLIPERIAEVETLLSLLD